MKSAQVAGSRRARVAAREAQRQRSQRFFAGGIALLVGLFAVVLVMTRPESDRPADAPAQTRSVTVTGDALPPLAEQDAALGMTIPSLEGRDFSGNQIRVEPGAGPKVIIFLAHWCPHCQAEVPAVQSWIDTEGMPQGVELISVATATDPAQPNYPPSEWLERKNWTVPVIVDDELSSAGAAFGVNSYPFFVFVDEDGKVHHRQSGEIPVADLGQMINDLAR